MMPLTRRRKKTEMDKFILAKGREAGNLAEVESKREEKKDKRTGVREPLPKGRIIAR